MQNKTLYGRRLSRAQAVQLLYQAEICERSVSQILAQGDVLVSDGPASDYAIELARESFEHIDEFNQILQGLSKNWEADRISPVERCILYIALYELKYEENENVNSSIIIDEALELSHEFGCEDAYKLINGILGKYVREQNSN